MKQQPQKPVPPLMILAYSGASKEVVLVQGKRCNKYKTVVELE